jgi:transposase-like protein
MEQWEAVRLRCERDGEPIKRVARELGISANTVRKYLRAANAPTAPRYRRPSRLERFVDVIDALLRSTPLSGRRSTMTFR